MRGAAHKVSPTLSGSGTSYGSKNAARCTYLLVASTARLPELARGVAASGSREPWPGPVPARHRPSLPSRGTRARVGTLSAKQAAPLSRPVLRRNRTWPLPHQGKPCRSISVGLLRRPCGASNMQFAAQVRMPPGCANRTADDTEYQPNRS